MQGPAGPQGAAGVSSPIIFIPDGTPPPAGYTLIGTLVGDLKVGDRDDDRGRDERRDRDDHRNRDDDRGRDVKTRPVRFNVYVKN
jgi:hypothetical protein